MIGKVKISRKAFYAAGGFSNPALSRKQRGSGWAYYQSV